MLARHDEGDASDAGDLGRGLGADMASIKTRRNLQQALQEVARDGRVAGGGECGHPGRGRRGVCQFGAGTREAGDKAT